MMHYPRLLVALAAGLITTTFIKNAAAESPKFAWLSLAPEVGYAFYSKGELEKDYGTDINARNSFVVKGHVDLGGDKLALELAPLYAWEGCSGLVGNLNALGGEITLVYRFKSNNIYPGIGIGFHGAYLFPNDNVKRGVELFGRVPLGLTWYFMKYVGLVLEGGFLFGGTGIRFKDVEAVPGNLYENTEYAFNLGFDLLVGLRFP
jgi:hypothetical protein